MCGFIIHIFKNILLDFVMNGLQIFGHEKQP